MMRIGRETIDIDLLASKVINEKEAIKSIMQEIASIDLCDGFTLTFSNIVVLAQPHMPSSGFRITLDVMFEQMHDKIHLDIGVGDVVEPIELELDLAHYKN